MTERAARLTAAALLVSVGIVAVGSVIQAAPARADTDDLRLPGGPTSATDQRPVSLDARIYLPDSVPAPAVVLAHGFGGSKIDLDQRASDLSDRGYVVLAYSARGFGTSTGLISMNSPDFEVADARALIDYLGTRDDVEQDGPSDPRVGFAGGSYGGALALLTAGYDQRVDAVAADITWNDLETSLFGQSLVAAEPERGVLARGVFKEQWTGAFFGAGLATRDGQVTSCGRFTEQWCAAYTQAAADDVVSPESSRLMRQSSPGSVADRITAPTLLSGGEADSLFPLAQLNANARQIALAHPTVPLKVVWHGGGHDGGIDESARLDELAATWFDAYLNGDSAAVDTSFEITKASGTVSAQSSGAAPVILKAPAYPGIHGDSTTTVPLFGPQQRVLAPPGGVPAVISSLPGLGGSVAALAQRPVPGQLAAFDSEPLTAPISIIGSSTVRLKFARAEPGSDETALFASLRVVSPNGRETFPQGLVAPVRLEGVGTTPMAVTVDLPAIVASAGIGDRLRIVIATTDFAYRLPRQPQLYDISLADAGLVVPHVAAEPVAAGPAPYWWLIGALGILAILVLVGYRLRPRHPADPAGPDPASPGDVAPPLVILALSKRYGDGYLAVDDVSFTVERGMVLGLLGPNGAGKTTTMRMVMGLIMPTGGAIEAFGRPVYAGAPVLARVGSLVEGAGFLPHLTGRQNLDLFWRAAGRTHDDPCLDEVLAIADLGSAIDKRVKSYSQGMRQRLGIAQAMLGKPDLLLLDEPTNGLDPPQIKEMRDVLHAYADSGRTVVISSHMLSEVEQTCSDVVVMHRGRLVGAGSVAELLRGHGGQRLEDVFLEIVGDDLTVGLS